MFEIPKKDMTARSFRRVRARRPEGAARAAVPFRYPGFENSCSFQISDFVLRIFPDV